MAITKCFSQEAPHLAETERAANLQRLIDKVLSFSLLAAAGRGLVIAVLNQPLLGLYGQTYQAAWPVLLVLIAARVLEGPVSIGVKLLNLEGYGKKLVIVNVVTGASFVGLLAALVALWGEIGAALAVLVFGLLSNVVFYRRTMTYTGLRLMPGFRLGQLRLGASS